MMIIQKENEEKSNYHQIILQEAQIFQSNSNTIHFIVVEIFPRCKKVIAQ